MVKRDSTKKMDAKIRALLLAGVERDDIVARLEISHKRIYRAALGMRKEIKPVKKAQNDEIKISVVEHEGIAIKIIPPGYAIGSVQMQYEV